MFCLSLGTSPTPSALTLTSGCCCSSSLASSHLTREAQSLRPPTPPPSSCLTSQAGEVRTPLPMGAFLWGPSVPCASTSCRCVDPPAAQVSSVAGELSSAGTVLSSSLNPLGLGSGHGKYFTNMWAGRKGKGGKVPLSWQFRTPS